MPKLHKLSEEKLRELKAEYDFLRGERSRQVADQIKEARSFGDLSENSEYDEAKNEQGKLYARINDLDEILSNYEIIDDSVEKDYITTGQKIRVRDVEEGDEDIYTIVGSTEADPAENRISDESPFGRAMIGKRVGDIAVVEAPQGNLKFEILEINI